MKAKIPILIVGILLFVTATSKGDLTLEVYQDTVIQPGDQFNVVHTYDDATVGMTGGRVYTLFTGGNSTFSLFDGQIDGVFTRGESRLYMYGGQLGVNILVADSGTISVFGGDFSADINIPNFGKVIFYGYDFQFEEQSQMLTGYLLDGSSFETWLGRAPEPFIGPDYAIVPEPSTLLILSIGALFGRQTKTIKIIC